MATSGRLATASDGQLYNEFCSRDLSDYLDAKRASLFILINEIGPPIWASEPTAAALLGVEGFTLKPPYHLTVPRERCVRRLGHVIHRSDDIGPIDRTQVGRIPVLSATRTLIDLSRSTPAKHLGVAVDSAINKLLTTESVLRRRVEELRSSGKHGIPKLLDVLDGSQVEHGGQSWLEREFLRLIDASGLPRPAVQQVLSSRESTVVRVDFRFEGTPVVVETFGYRWHRTVQQIAVDAARFNALLLDGFLPLQFTYSQVTSEGGAVVSTVKSALARYQR
jgi:hypothetical protein